MDKKQQIIQDEIIQEIRDYLDLKTIEQQISKIGINNYKNNHIAIKIQPRGELDSKNYSIFFSHNQDVCNLNLIEIHEQSDILMIKNELRIFFPILFLKELLYQLAYWNRSEISGLDNWVEKMVQQEKLKRFYSIDEYRPINTDNKKKIFWLNFIKLYCFILQANDFKMPEYSSLLAEYGFAKNDQKILSDVIQDYLDDIGGIQVIKKIMLIFQNIKINLDYNFIQEIFSIISNPALKRLLIKSIKQEISFSDLEDDLVLGSFVKKIKLFNAFKKQKETLPSIYIKELILVLQKINQAWQELSKEEKESLKFKLASR